MTAPFLIKYAESYIGMLWPGICHLQFPSYQLKKILFFIYNLLYQNIFQALFSK
jgi:hypothetical protein